MNQLRMLEEKMGIRVGKVGKKIAITICTMAFMVNCAMMPSVYAREQTQEQEQVQREEEIGVQNQEELQEQEQDKEDGSGITEQNKIMTAMTDLDAKASPDDASETVISYRDGDSVFVTGETEDGWYCVRYQDMTGYIRVEQLSEMELDVEALDDEFGVEEAEGIVVVEEVERQRTEARRSRIWGAVIVLLVLGVFATGIISTVRGGKKEEIGMEEEDNRS